MSSYSERMADQDVVPHDEYGDENQLQEFFKFVREYFEMEQKWDEVQQFGTEHPLASVFLIVTMAMCAVPITLFALFIMGSVAVSIAGFLFFEGTVVAVACFVFGGVLLFTGFLAVGFSIFLIGGYYAVSLAGNMFSKVTSQMPALPWGAGSGVVSKSQAKKD